MQMQMYTEWGKKQKILFVKSGPALQMSLTLLSGLLSVVDSLLFKPPANTYDALPASQPAEKRTFASHVRILQPPSTTTSTYKRSGPRAREGSPQLPVVTTMASSSSSAAIIPRKDGRKSFCVTSTAPPILPTSTTCCLLVQSLTGA